MTHTKRDITNEVQLTRTVIRECKYLKNAWEICEQFHITKAISYETA